MHQHHLGIQPIGQLGQAEPVKQTFLKASRTLEQGEAVSGSDLMLQNLETLTWIELPLTQPFNIQSFLSTEATIQGWNAKGVLLSGRDPDAHWGNPPRPAQD